MPGFKTQGDALIDYINSLKSTKPAPGGGSVAAVLTELSAALLHMACAISAHSSQNSDEKRAKLNVICERIDACLERAESLALQDEEAYREVSRAFKKKAQNDEEIIVRKATIQQACSMASEVPCDVIDLAYDTLTLTSDVAPYINKSLLSDVAIVVAIVQASAKSALYLVHANLGYLDSSEAQRVYKRADKTFTSLKEMAYSLETKLDEQLLVAPTLREDV